jgi:hypothetical protein
MRHAVALLFGAQNNAKCDFDPSFLDVDHIIEGDESKSIENNLLLTNVQFLTRKQNKTKFYI